MILKLTQQFIDRGLTPGVLVIDDIAPTDPIKKVARMITSIRMPIMRAASGSCAVARMALPNQVRRTK